VRGFGGEAVAARADDANLVIIGMNFLFGHDYLIQDLSCNRSILA
jgi:hypothetical protein